MKLGYLLFDVRKPLRWQKFAQDFLGLPVTENDVDGSRGLQIDDAAQRLIVRPGARDDIGAIGLECDSVAELQALRARLAASGVAIAMTDHALLRARRVADLIAFDDPDGTRIEAFVGLEPAAAAFASPCFPSGFVTGAGGLGHAVLVSRQIEILERFYADVVGFAVTERLNFKVGPIGVRGTFLHCNRRHHSLALFDIPSRRRLHHFMLQAREIRDVGAAYERGKKLGVPPSLSLGQHPDPDGTFSFYGATPSGFDFEIGAGGHEIDPAGWREGALEVSSTWGHQPSLRLKLRTATDFLIGARGN